MPVNRLVRHVSWSKATHDACDRMEAAGERMFKAILWDDVQAAEADYQEAKKAFGDALLASDKARDPTRYGLPAHHTRLPGLVRKPPVLACE